MDRYSDLEGTLQLEDKDLKRNVSQKWVEMAILIILICFAIFVLFAKPIPGAVYSPLGILVLLTVAWVYYNLMYLSGHDFLRNNYLRIWFLFLFLCQIIHLSVISWNTELVLVYQTLFDALDNGLNPYQEAVIYHRLPDGSGVLVPFNYPPGEILVYWIPYQIFGHWNYGLILLINFVIQLTAILIIQKQTPEIGLKQKLPFFVLLTILNLNHSASTIFLTMTLAGLLLLDQQALDKSYKRRILLILIFTIGLLSKFYMIPLVAVYYWHNVIDQRQLKYLVDAVVNLFLVVILLIPFGIVAVFESTILFNLDLDLRQESTSYYPNLLSIMIYLLKLKSLYLIIVVGTMFGSLMVTRRMELLKRITLILCLSLLIFPTPEDQFFGSLIAFLFLTKVGGATKIIH
ncbi:MAG: hypothetical protein IH840_06560 [Candidatus Heimdallarchaeota archaeon]|nr:hypothetical protein [Candidatus Heimdallarchaeota archaeon]